MTGITWITICAMWCSVYRGAGVESKISGLGVGLDQPVMQPQPCMLDLGEPASAAEIAA
jgi:hypothetical protein